MRSNNYSKNQGFTLIELIVTIAVAIILATVAVPSFRSIIIENRLTSQTNNFISSLALARSEAVKRGARVTLCKSADGASCAASGGYDQGWIVFVDTDDSGDRTSTDPDVNEPLIRVFEAMPESVEASGNGSIATSVSYLGTGFTDSQNGTITICTEGALKREIIIIKSGRASSVKGGADGATVCS